MSVSIETIPKRVFTDAYGDHPRLAVEPGEAAFYDGRQFRMFKEFSQPAGTHIPAGGTFILKIVSTVNFIVFDSEVAIDNGFIRTSTVGGGVEGGVFTSIPVFPLNSMTGTPVYATGITLSGGGTLTGGTTASVSRVKTASSSAQASTVPGEGRTAGRGFPPGTYYVRCENIGTGDIEGTIKLQWSEEV